MKSLPLRGARTAAPALIAILAAACDLSTPTEVQEPRDLELDFCSTDVPVWFAYQNQDGSTTRLTADPDGTFRFTATNRVVIGMVWQDGADYHTEVVYATNDELAAISSASCLEESGTKVVNGTVSGFGTGQVAVVSMGFNSAPLQPGNTSFSLTSLPDRPLDVVASRQNVSGVSRAADRVLLRRAQSFVNNGTMPPIDFASGTDVVSAATANASISGIFTSDFASVQNNFFSQLETSHSLSHTEGIGNGTQPFAAIPPAQVAAGDYHDLILLAVDATGASVRGVENFFRATGPQTLALGPPLNEPTITPLPGSAYVRLRMTLPSQNSYDDAVSVFYHQQLSLSATSVRLWATFGFLRSVFGSWVLEIPDLSGADGWQDAWGLRTGAPIEWTVTAFGGRSTLMFGAKPEEGEFVRYALRHSQPAAPAPAMRAIRDALPRAFRRR